MREVLPYHKQGPDGVVEEDGGRCDEHAEAYETVKLDYDQQNINLTPKLSKLTILGYMAEM